MVASKIAIAQTIETMKGPTAPYQLQVGGHPKDIAVNTATNKIYILNPEDGTVTVLDSKSGTVKSIPVGLGSPILPCAYCIGVDYMNNKIYVANEDSDTVSVIDGNDDTVKKTIPVGSNPSFILVTTYPKSGKIPTGHIAYTVTSQTCCKIYVANNDHFGTISVIDGTNDTVEKTIRAGTYPAFIAEPTYHLYDEIYVASSDYFLVYTYNGTLIKMKHLPYERISARGMYINDTRAYVLPSSDTQNAYSIKLPIADNSTIEHIPIKTLLYRLLSLKPYDAPTVLPRLYLPTMVADFYPNFTKIIDKIYALNSGNATVSVFSKYCTHYAHERRYHCTRIQMYIPVGQHPDPIAIND